MMDNQVFSVEEQETVINYDALSKQWDFYTSVTAHIEGFIKLSKGQFETLGMFEGKVTAMRFRTKTLPNSIGINL